MKGKFIVFEGPDGSGQSTQAEMLRNYLSGKGYPVLLTKEPTEESDAGRKIRHILGGEIKYAPDKLQELFVEDRREHLKNLIVPALNDGKVVISDRYFFSTIAFGSLNCDKEWLIGMNREFLVPDATFVLVVRPEVCLERIMKRGKQIELFEEVEKLRKVIEAYMDMPRLFSGVDLVYGEHPPEEVFQNIRTKVDALL